MAARDCTLQDVKETYCAPSTAPRVSPKRVRETVIGSFGKPQLQQHGPPRLTGELAKILCRRLRRGMPVNSVKERVLLVKDDHDKFLFDVSTVPHMTLDFTNDRNARGLLQSELMARLREQQFTTDARVRIAVEGLTNHEVTMLTELLRIPDRGARGWNITGTVLSVYEMALARLSEKRLIRLVGKFPTGFPGYQLTPLGRVVAEHVKNGLQQFRVDQNIDVEVQATKPDA